jgi:hypothetical protein
MKGSCHTKSTILSRRAGEMIENGCTWAKRSLLSGLPVARTPGGHGEDSDHVSCEGRRENAFALFPSDHIMLYGVEVTTVVC